MNRWSQVRILPVGLRSLSKSEGMEVCNGFKSRPRLEHKKRLVQADTENIGTFSWERALSPKQKKGVRIVPCLLLIFWGNPCIAAVYVLLPMEF